MEENDYIDASSIDALDDYDLNDEYIVNELQDEPEELNNVDEQETNDIILNNPDIQNQEIEQDEDLDFTSKVLQLKGIKDPNKIKFVDESGAEVERSWDDLSEAEQLTILTNQEDPERDLDEEEIIFINTLRSNNLTPQQYIQTIRDQAAQEAVSKFQQTMKPVYEIDLLNDDELFILDLLEKVGEDNISDDELREALEQAKSNEALFSKLIEGLRATYKNLEDLKKYSEEQERAAQMEQQYQAFANEVLNQISGISSLANQEIELSTNDKNDIANYMLTRRESGMSDFYTDIQKPGVATAAAFWLLKGSEVLNEMENLIKAAYQRGYNMGKSQIGKSQQQVLNNKPQVVVQNSMNKKPSIDLLSAFSLGDESYLN